MKKTILLICFFTSLFAEDRMYQLMKDLVVLQPAAKGFIAKPFRESLVTDANRPNHPQFFTKIETLIAEQRYNAFCDKPYDSKALIPPVVHMIWLGSPPPLSIDLVIASWKKYNPSFEVKLWTDRDVENFPWSCVHSKMFYDKTETWSEKSDILRFEILYQNGGIYCDTDMVCLNSFEELLKTGISFFAGYQYNFLGFEDIGSALIGSSKGNSVMRGCILHSKTREEAPNMMLPSRSGPGPLTRACYEGLIIGEENMLLLPCTYIFPLPYHKKTTSFEEVKKFIKPETLAIHLWEGSWMKG